MHLVNFWLLPIPPCLTQSSLFVCELQRVGERGNDGPPCTISAPSCKFIIQAPAAPVRCCPQFRLQLDILHSRTFFHAFATQTLHRQHPCSHAVVQEEQFTKARKCWRQKTRRGVEGGQAYSSSSTPGIAVAPLTDNLTVRVRVMIRETALDIPLSATFICLPCAPGALAGLADLLTKLASTRLGCPPRDLLQTQKIRDGHVPSRSRCPALELSTRVKAGVAAPAQCFTSTVIEGHDALSDTLLLLERGSHSFLVQILISVLCISQLPIPLDQCLPI